MRIYDKYVLPFITQAVCSAGTVMKQRQKIVPSATGNVLEIGFGSGLNLGYYDHDKVKHLWGLDPSQEMWAIAKKRIRDQLSDVEFLNSPAEQIPLDNNAADTVVMTYTLCSVTDVRQVMAEIRRVLKPNGQLLFCEHGAAPDPGVRKWQNRLNPTWKRFGGGCNLNRDIPVLIKEGGFKMSRMESGYINFIKPASFNFLGVARIV